MEVGFRRWATLSATEALSALGSSERGLSSMEAAERLTRFGANTLPRPSRPGWYVELGSSFVHLFAILLWAGAALAWLAGMPQLAWAIVAVIVINGLFSYWQEYQAQRATEALQALLPHQVVVRRDGEDALVAASAVVSGDLLVLTEGETVPADGRLISATELRLDLSTLTGESRPIPRTAEPARSAEGKAPSELPNLVLAGTTVARGLGTAVVFATAADTEFGRIARLTQEQKEQPSPLQREVGRITRLIAVLALGFGAASFLIGTSIGNLPATVGFLFAVGIIVANVPEGLLPTLTLALALGVRRMALRRALVKRLSSVETLGATTVILTDKTGTLTENEMTVREAWAGGSTYRFSGVGYDPAGFIEPRPGVVDGDDLMETLRVAALCCDARLVPPASGGTARWTAIGDPTEAAILVAAAKASLTAEALAMWPRIAELPFDSVRKRMTIVHRIGPDLVACVKGAPTEIMPRCSRQRSGGRVDPLTPEGRLTVEMANDAFARRGLRVLAVASRIVDRTEEVKGWEADNVEEDLTFLGLVSMEDPPRPEVPDALAACGRAGVRVVMVTGDDGRTAAAIGQEVGLVRGDAELIAGARLDTLTDLELDRILNHPDILFARATPEHKLRLVEAFQRRGDVVAVTGDGVNDAPALKRADIGVAMGATGTDVAREAADMVLTDDNFASIVAAIEEGRAIYDNVRKFVVYVVVSNVAEMAPFVAFVLFHVPLPLTVMQILAVDLGTDLFPALALGMERPEPDVMSRSPRRRSERLFTPGMVVRAYGWLGLIEAALGLGGFFGVYLAAGWRPGEPMGDYSFVYTTATTMTLAGIVAGQVGNAFACRSSHQSALKIGLISNPALLVGVAVECALLAALIYLPPLASVFELAPLGVTHWLVLACFPPTLLLLEEARKAVRRHTLSGGPAYSTG